MKYLLRAFLFFFLLTIIGIYALLHTAWLSRLLAEKANTAISRLLGVPVEISWIKWKVLTNTLVAGDIIWLKKGDLPWIEIPWAEIQFGWLNLSFFPFRAQKITLISPRIRLKLDEKGNLLPLSSFLEKKKEGESQGNPNFVVNKVEIAGGDIEIEIADPPSVIHLPLFSLHLTLEEGKPQTAWIAFEKGLYQLFTWQYEGLSGEIHLKFQKDLILLKEWKVHGELPALDFAGTGLLHPGGDPLLTLEIQGMADVSLVNLHYTSFPEFLGTSLISTRLFVTKEGRIRLTSGVYSRDLLIEGKRMDEISIEIELNEKGIDFTSIKIVAEGGKIEGTGRIRWQKEVRLSFSTQMEDVNLDLFSILLGNLPLGMAGNYRGKMNLDLAVDPVLKGEIHGTGQAELKRLILVPPHSLPEFSAHITLALNLSSELLHLQTIEFYGSDFSGSLTGTVPLHTFTPTFSGKVLLEELSPWVESAIGIPAEGKGEIAFTVAGDQVALEIAGAPVIFYTTHFDRASARISVEKGVLDLKDFEGEREGGTLSLHGEIALDSLAYRLQSSFVNFHLSSLGIPIPFSHKVNGKAFLVGKKTDIPEIEGNLTLSLFLPGFPIEVTLTGKGERVDAILTKGLSGSLSAVKERDALYFTLLAISTPLEIGLSPGPIPLDLRGGGHCFEINSQSCFVHLFASSADLSSLISFLWDKGELSLIARFQENHVFLTHAREDPEGYLYAHLKGGWRKDPIELRLDSSEFFYHWPWGSSWKKGRGEASLGRISAVLKGIPFEAIPASPFSILHEKIILSPFPVFVKGGKVIVSGSLPWDLQGPSQLSLNGTVPTEILSLFWENPLFHHGELEIALQLSQILPFPSMNGTISLERGEVVIPAIDEPIVNVKASSRVEQYLLKIVAFSGEWGEGTIVGSGFLSLFPDPFRDLRIYGSIESKRIVVRSELSTGASGKITITPQANRRLLISGDLDLSHLNFHQKIILEQMLLKLRPRYSSETSSREVPLDLRLHLTGSREILAETNLFEGPFQFDIWLIGAPSQPSVTGNVRLLPEGTIAFRNRVFQIRRGVIQFSDPQRLAPFLDLEAETALYHPEERQRYLIRMQVYGPYDHLTIRFLSDPPLEELDVLSLLSFGVLAKDLGRSQRNVGQTGGVEIANLVLLSQISSLEEELKAVGGFDLIEIQPYYVSSLGSSSILLSAEKRLTSHLRIRAGTTLDPSGEQRFEVGYDLNRNFHILFGWDNRTPSGTGNFSLRPRLWFPLP